MGPASGAGAPCRATATSSESFVERAAHRHCPRSPTSYEELLSPTPHAVSRWSANGSPTVPSCVSRGPWASRSCNGAESASSPTRVRSPARTSSGLTDGVPCRKTISSIAHSPSIPGRAAELQRHDGRAAVESAQPLLGHPLDEHLLGGEERGHALRPLLRGHRRDRRTPDAGLEQVREGPARGLHDLQDVEPGGQRLVEGGEHLGGVGDLAPGRSRGTPPRWRHRWARRRRRRSAGAG